MTRTPVGDRHSIHFFIDRSVLDMLKKVAELKNTTYSELIRTACREYLLREAVRVKSDRATLKELAK
jgi:hypothetical protein